MSSTAIAQRNVGLVDPYGNPLGSATRQRDLQRKLMQARYEIMRARYDAARTITSNELHWQNADNLDPHSVASLEVRRTLRSRSRYELIENNPWLKGCILTICNDFVGSGPALKITDKRMSPERRKLIQRKFREYSKRIKLRQILWRMRMAKIVDGEAFARLYAAPRRDEYPIRARWQIIECDRVSSDSWKPVDRRPNEIDGVRFNNYEEPLEYHILNQHPGNTQFFARLFANDTGGQWVKARNVLHWFRQDRGWLRGIPELNSSLPLCSILRRYTLAVVQHAEVAADMTAIIESDGPPGMAAWSDGSGNLQEDDPFDAFPIEQGMITNLPWGYKLKQLDAVPLGVQYDAFVGSVLREITRPALIPFHMVVGTAKDSNMASSVVDIHIYKQGQRQERLHCEEDILDQVVRQWWLEATRIPRYFQDEALPEADMLLSNPSMRFDPPEHTFRWDRVGIDHTDPTRIAQAITTLRQDHILTDEQIQEEYYNRDVEEWREDVEEDEEFRQSITPKPVLPDGSDLAAANGNKRQESKGAKTDED